MAKLRFLKISHFRGIKNFEQIFGDGITCIIGRGDSCKSTILDAIAYVFAPSWSIRLNDSDFYMCDTTSPIVIEGVVSDIPDELILKYSDHLRGITKDYQLVDDMESEEAHDALSALTIRLTIRKDLEPSWEVVSYNGVESSIIKATDRGKLNVFSVSEYTDRHFSLNKGNPLYSLYQQLNGNHIADDENHHTKQYNDFYGVIDKKMKGSTPSRRSIQTKRIDEYHNQIREPLHLKKLIH